MNTRKFIARQVFEDLMPIYPLYLLFFEDKGMSMQQISALLVIWCLTVVLLEIPTGILADRWSRKNMVLLGSLFKAACYFLWSFSNRFELFALGFVLWGISSAFISGSEEALLYDSLKQEEQELAFERILGKGRFASGVSVILASVSGGLIGTYLGIHTVLYLSTFFSLVSAGIALSYKEINHYRARLEEVQTEKKDTLKEAIAFIVHNKEILVFSLLAIMVIGTAEVLDEYDSMIARDYGLTLAGIGVWSAIRLILVSSGGILASRLRKFIEKITGNKSPFHTATLICIIAAACLSLSGLLRVFGVMGLYGIYYLLMSAANVLQEAFLQHRIEDEGRSTVHSIISLSFNLYGILCIGVIGQLLTRTDLLGMLVYVAVYIITLTLILKFILHFKKHRATS